jgi:hypothetical protein
MVVLHNLTGNGQAESRALAGGLGGEQGLETPFRDLRRNARSVVVHEKRNPSVLTLYPQFHGAARRARIAGVEE